MLSDRVSDVLPFIALGAFLIIAHGLHMAWRWMAARDEARAIGHSRAFLKAVVNTHLRTLALKRRQTLRRDDYGNLVQDAWVREKRYFWDTVVSRSPHAYRINFWHGPERTDGGDATIAVIDELIDELIDESQGIGSCDVAGDVDHLSADAYEAYCAQLLNQDGWEAFVGGGPGDQGVDIIATKTGLKAVFQCKKYSKPVGNRAVQEAIAGRAFSKADLAFVVANTTYTTSAHELASASGVYLIHHSQLLDLSAYLLDARSA